jgi:hypothetical protein
MNFVEVQSYILNHFYNNYTGVAKSKIQLPNQEFTIPSDTWVEVSMNVLDTEQSSIGAKNNRVYKDDWLFLVKIRVPVESATNDGWLLTQAVVDLYEGETITGGLRCNTVIPRDVGPVEDSWYMFTAEVYLNNRKIK